MEITVKNVKVHEGLSEETLCFTATVYVDGEKAARVSNRGCGGCHEYDTFNPKTEKWESDLLNSAIAWANEQTIIIDEGTDREFELTFEKFDYLVNQAVQEFEDNRWIKRAIKTKTVFKMKKDGVENWYTINAPYSERVAAHLAEKYGDAVIEIANETRS